MVVVLVKLRLIFIEEPRTASRSTHTWLVRQGIGISPQKKGQGHDRHMGPARISGAMEDGELSYVDFLKDTLAEYQYFAMLRNPFATAITYFVKARNGDLRDQLLPCQIAREERTFIKFLPRLQRELPGWLSEQPHLDRLAHCQHLLRFEDGFPNQIFAFLQSRGMQLTSAARAAFPHQGKTSGKRKDWRSYYDEATKERVARIYARYCELYNYSFNSD